MVPNSRPEKGVDLYDLLHDFWEGRGTGTEKLEAKLAQQLAVLAHESLFQIFLDTRKEYDL